MSRKTGEYFLAGTTILAILLSRPGSLGARKSLAVARSFGEA